jgi:hypothetical protein
MCVFVSPHFKLIQLTPFEVPLDVISFLNLNSEISKNCGLLVITWKFNYAVIAFTMKMMNSNDNI